MKKVSKKLAVSNFWKNINVGIFLFLRKFPNITNRKLKFSLLVLSKDKVKKLSARDKKRLLMLTNMLRDMDLFRKMLVFVRKQKTGSKELDEASFVTLAFSFTKILISKVYEIWEFLNSEKIEQEKVAFSDSLSKWWNEIEAFFLEEKNKKLFCFIRNKFGFHFDYYPDLEPYIEDAMNEVGNLEFWMGNDSSGNDVFASSSTVMLTVLRNKMRELGFAGNEEGLIGQLQRLPIQISYIMNEFCKGYLTEIILKGHAFDEKSTIAVTAPLLSKVNLPLIVYNDLKNKGRF